MTWSRQSGEGTCSFNFEAPKALPHTPARHAKASVLNVALLRKGERIKVTKHPLMALNCLFSLIIFDFLG
jgi:hypothetical protein